MTIHKTVFQTIGYDQGVKPLGEFFTSFRSTTWERSKDLQDQITKLHFSSVARNFDWGPKIEKSCDVSFVTFFSDVMKMTS